VRHGGAPLARPGLRKFAPRPARHYSYIVGVIHLEPLVPVTVRLSQAFYDRFGEQVTNELVEWFNQVDLTYRTDLRTLNDTNFARFEALLESRFARADLQLERQLNERFGEFERRIDLRFGEMDQRFGELEHRSDLRFGEFERRMERRLSELEPRFAGLERDIGELRRGQSQQLRWMVGLWMTTTVGLLAVLATVMRQG
jgi:tetrahydromethanopterin S-methyltransferase subunit G